MTYSFPGTVELLGPGTEITSLSVAFLCTLNYLQDRRCPVNSLSKPSPIMSSVRTSDSNVEGTRND